MNFSNLSFDHDVLKCPACSGENLHHHKIRVFERLAGEDGDGLVAEISDGFSIHQIPDDKIPGRRNSLEIGFWCETCDTKLVLRIKQHKGLTIFEWVKWEDSDE